MQESSQAIENLVFPNVGQESQNFQSSSKSKLWNHDVFFSFRGEDTRKGFTGHLHAAFKYKGYKAYMDEDDLKRGEEIKEELFRAIEESRVSIIVFSKRKQNGDLAEVFKKHEKGIDEEKDDKKHESKKERVKQWREALTKAADLSGHHLQITDNR
ncbi:disease resistance protein Roq1-like [Malus domestica]|uniref:disease resistance protein Roq1-like n=1 Tax=Malus domestica TaxID=3750 RepID=UPI003975442D